MFTVLPKDRYSAVVSLLYERFAQKIALHFGRTGARAGAIKALAHISCRWLSGPERRLIFAMLVSAG
jgi:hypothetical protein